MKKSDRDYALRWMKARGKEPAQVPDRKLWFWPPGSVPETVWNSLCDFVFPNRSKAIDAIAEALAEMRADIAIPKPKKRPAAKARGKR